MSLKPTGIMAGLEYFTVHQRSDRYVPSQNTSGGKSRKWEQTQGLFTFHASQKQLINIAATIKL